MYLQLNVDPSGVGLDLEVPLEVIIGTIPLASVVQQYPPMQPSTSFGFAGNFPEPSAPSAEVLYPEAPPTGIPNLRELTLLVFYGISSLCLPYYQQKIIAIIVFTPD